MNFLNKTWSTILTDDTKTATILDLKEQLIIANTRQIDSNKEMINLNSELEKADKKNVAWDKKFGELCDKFSSFKSETGDKIKNQEITIMGLRLDCLDLDSRNKMQKAIILNLKEELGMDEDEEIEISPMYDQEAINEEIEGLLGGDNDQ